MISTQVRNLGRRGPALKRAASQVTVTAILVSSLGIAHAQSAGSKPAGKTAANASVHQRVAESDLTTVELSAAAERRLRVELKKVEARSMPLRLSRSGVVEIPDTSQVRLVAPVSGSIAREQQLPAIGERIEAGQSLFCLRFGEDDEGRAFGRSDRLAVLRARADLEGQAAAANASVRQSTATRDMARAASERALELQRVAAGSAKAVEEAQAAVLVAEAALKGAEARAESISRALDELQTTSDESLATINSPIAGVVRGVFVHPGDPVAAGTALIEIAELQRSWIRVSVYFTEYAELHDVASATLVAAGGGGLTARRLDLPTRGDPVTGMVDLLFETDAASPVLVPGQRVLLQIDLRTEVRRIVPREALLFDYLGGAWVYERIAPQIYRRVRIEIGDVIDGQAVFVAGPELGAQIVVAGAAELFGVEFGAGK